MSINEQTFIPIPFAENASNTYKFEITSKNETSDTNKASFEQGFPPITMQDINAGGIPPFGQDFNGILHVITQAIRYTQAGNYPLYDSDFASAIGGYAVGAVVMASDGDLYKNQLDGNKSNPERREGWIKFLNNANVIGDSKLFKFRKDELPFGWYFENGDKYPIESPQGQALKYLSDNYKLDWNIIEADGYINLPNMFHSDGRGMFPRPVEGTSRQVGSVEDDAIRNINGVFPVATPDSFQSNTTGCFYGDTLSNKGGNSASKLGNFIIIFDASRVVPTADENRPLNVGMIPAIYLGV